MIRTFLLLSFLFLPLTANAFSTGKAKGILTGKHFKQECVEKNAASCEDVFNATFEAMRYVDQNMGLYLVFQHQKLKQVLRKNKASEAVKKDVLKYTDPKLRQTVSKCFPKDKNLYETVQVFVGKNSAHDKKSLSEIIHLAAFEYWICKRPK